jgi:uroporphyrinogen decarboxylase
MDNIEARSNKPFLRVFTGDAAEPPPFWLMRQAGRYLPEYRAVRARSGNFLEFCYTPELAVEVTLQPLKRYAMDAAIMFCDILVVPDALGQKVEFREGQGPVLEPIRAASDVEKLSRQRFDEHLQPVYETIRELRRQIPENTALIGFAGAPWTVATYMVEGKGGTDFSRVRRWGLEEPETFSRIIDLLVEATSAYLVEQVRNGVEALQIFDSWAGVLDESEFRRWVIEPTATIVRSVREVFPDTPIIGFPKGAGARYVEYGSGTGVDGLSLDSGIPVDWAARELQGNHVVQGNLDNLVLLKGGEVLEREAKRILEALGRGPFVFNLGHGILPETPPENVARLAEVIRNWRNPS